MLQFVKEFCYITFVFAVSLAVHKELFALCNFSLTINCKGFVVNKESLLNSLVASVYPQPKYIITVGIKTDIWYKYTLISYRESLKIKSCK